MLPPTYFLLAILLMLGIHIWAPLPRLLSLPYTLVGAVPIVVGGAMNVWASGRFSRLGTPIHPFRRSTRLLTDGLYRYTRNPMYLGLVLILLGLSLILGTLGPFLVLPVFVWWIQRRFIVVEERALDQGFGERYREYRRRVRRWL